MTTSRPEHLNVVGKSGAKVCGHLTFVPATDTGQIIRFHLNSSINKQPQFQDIAGRDGQVADSDLPISSRVQMAAKVSGPNANLLLSN